MELLKTGGDAVGVEKDGTIVGEVSQENILAALLDPRTEVDR
jgi:hypothetical protein